MNKKAHALRRIAAIAAVSASCVSGSLMLTEPSDAATTGGYPSAIVETGAATRTEPYLNNTYWGAALPAPNTGGRTRQTVSVKCFWDGDWATGNYRSNRWFEVFVWNTSDGYNVPRWLFVHSSYVYNQPSVPRCQQTGAGIF